MTKRVLCLLATVAIIDGGLINSRLAGASLPSVGQTPANQAPTAFDVATIKPSDPSARGDGCYIRGLPGGQTFVGRCVNLHLLITYSYRISDSQLSGGPDWLNTELWDFQAKAEHPTNRAELPAMFQAMLVERFGLKFHHETRTLPALVLTLDKGGPKMKANNEPDKWDISIVSAGGGQPPTPPKWAGQRCSMSYLSWWLGRLQNRPALDQTGLPGFWDFTLSFVPYGAEGKPHTGPNGDPLPAFEGPTIYTALREQLGLKLESMKAPVEVMIIDHVEKANAN